MTDDHTNLTRVGDGHHVEGGDCLTCGVKWPCPAADEPTRYESHAWDGKDECVACGVTWEDCDDDCPGPGSTDEGRAAARALYEATRREAKA